MSQTIPNATVGKSWVSLNATANIPVGTQFKIQNLNPRVAGILAEGTRPLESSRDGDMLNGRMYFGSQVIASSGSLEVWCRSESDVATIELSVSKL
ncbi:hypothetical protein Aeh1ORF028c [Aeromonas phage Aeh1]|uniref:Uncharacterized protein n=1 Tax=Aeromonas phage Aeh1 TaxID=2880362 RepID=Q76Z61_9CAUD|nr:hypothetical protein Aeh1p030 [Aeromonas phage Aeh1]AAQ17685.1 hypothetical protein Aeh1ORF028c [Aeromonas phage Aeh1]